jgi:hypothetical protein
MVMRRHILLFSEVAFELLRIVLLVMHDTQVNQESAHGHSS